MDANIVNKLTALKNKLESEKEQQIKNQAILDNNLKILKNDFDCDNLDEAIEMANTAEEEIQQEEIELEKKLSLLEKEI